MPERWEMQDSKNHMILLQIDEWFTSGLAGIRQAPGSVGYRRLIIDPRVAGDLTHVAGSYETPYGEAASEWTRRHGRFRLKVKVPPNTTAEVHVPARERNSHTAPRGARFIRFAGGRAVYRVASGSYSVKGTSVRGNS